MNIKPSISFRQRCEQVLKDGIRYNEENHILSSENVVATRLLSGGADLTKAYEDIYTQLHSHPRALPAFIDLVLGAVVSNNPEKMAEARVARYDLVKINRQIAKKATELAHLLQQRTALHNTSGFASDTHYHICEVIEGAAKGTPLFASYLAAPLNALRYRFDFKYWPKLSDIMQELASDAESAVLEPTDSLTAAGTDSVRASKADFFRALFVGIEENVRREYGPLPNDFKPADETIASLANWALALDPSEIVDGAYVKRFRQREREKAG